MEKLIRSYYETTINELVQNTIKRIAELEEEPLKKLKACKNLEEAVKIVSTYSKNITTLKQYRENLEYLKACDPDRKVQLNQTEWWHYLHGYPRPEWC